MPLNVPDGKAFELLDQLLDYDQTVEELEAEIVAAKKGLNDLKDTLKDTLTARAKLSTEIRNPPDLTGGKGKRKGA